LSKLRVSFEFAGPSVLVFGNQNMVTLPKDWTKDHGIGNTFRPCSCPSTLPAPTL